MPRTTALIVPPNTTYSNLLHSEPESVHTSHTTFPLVIKSSRSRDRVRPIHRAESVTTLPAEHGHDLIATCLGLVEQMSKLSAMLTSRFARGCYGLEQCFSTWFVPFLHIDTIYLQGVITFAMPQQGPRRESRGCNLLYFLGALFRYGNGRLAHFVEINSARSTVQCRSLST